MNTKMNKQQLEQLFDEKFSWDFKKGYPCVIEVSDFVEIKDFIFQTVIPETIKSILPHEGDSILPKENSFRGGYEALFEFVREKAKELYNINL